MGCRFARFLIVLSIGLAPVWSNGCSTAPTKAEVHALRGEWMQAVLEYRKAVNEDPASIEFKLRLTHAELNAANFYYREGSEFAAKGDTGAAIARFQQGLIALPTDQRLQKALNRTLAEREANSLYLEGVRHRGANRLGMARQSFTNAIGFFPDHKPSRAALLDIQREAEIRDASKLVLSSRAPITLKFRQTGLLTAFEFIAKAFEINVIFDEGVENVPITLFAKDVTFRQALNLLLMTSRTFFKRIGPNTLLIAPDNQEKRRQYDEQIVRMFQLNTIAAKNMVDILKGIVTPQKVIVNEEMNTLLIRDTDQVLKQVDRLIQLNDRVPAEVLIDVEILEVNRTEALRLGLDLGSEISYSFQQASSIGAALNTGTFTLPAITFRYFKQDVDAKTLANPQIRVIDGKLAKIHIGDRVPLRSSTIQDATGQTRTTFVYTDIGIQLNVEPTVHLDDSITIRMELEVSTLGQNLGTPDEPAFSIGTRNAETFMRLRDGETAILGGLIRDEERRTRIKVPGLGDIPILGAFFTSFDDTTASTEVLLTITPRIMRQRDLPAIADLQFHSGRAAAYAEESMFAYLEQSPEMEFPALPQIEIGESQGAAGIPPQPPRRAQPRPRGGAAAPGAPGRPEAPAPLLTFSEPLYESAVGEEFEIELVGENLGSVGELTVEILYKPGLIQILRGEAGGPHIASFETETDNTGGVTRLHLTFTQGAALGGKTSLARIILQGVKPGVSYLIYKTPKRIANAQGKPISAKRSASRVVIR